MKSNAIEDCRLRRGWMPATLLVLLAMLVLTLGLLAPAIAESTGARLEVPDDYFYFGYMPRDAVVSHTYWIRNTGTDTLKIVKVKPTCGCTAAPLVQDRVSPGDSANLTITFNSKLMNGKVVKDVDIFSNDAREEVKSIKFFAVVNRTYPNVTVDPPTLRFSKFGSKDGKIVKEMKVRNNFDEDIDLTFSEFPDRFFAIDKRTATIAPGEEASFTLEQVKIPTNKDDFLTSLTLQFEGPETERITVPIVCYFKTGE